ncbi:hypothetical protein [Cytobacillus dafuensis]|uniref:Uncharacterized protein n=1 Tax=Cytobacillus dafuensis TaxID=1742359 RepID=A0A5B8Z1V8_CYTDA|nr:hypothetical protein [Cytobacillus dafuensis]QED47004.1 hypothetical protein FSZ17_06975 [Cytobacillus dafuensis]
MNQSKCPHCYLCANYNPNIKLCTLRNIKVNEVGIDLHHCIENKHLIRYPFALSPKKYSSITEFHSIFKKDINGNPLFVVTKRGIEHAIQAGPGVVLMSHSNRGVPKVLTYQGQREIIYDLGFRCAYIEACKYNTPLFYYFYEKESKGQKDLINSFLIDNKDFIEELKKNRKLLVNTIVIQDKLSEEHQKFLS